MVNYIANFFNSLMGTPLPAVLSRCIAFALSMIFIKLIFGFFGKNNTKFFDYLTYSGITFMLIAQLAETAKLALSFGG